MLTTVPKGLLFDLDGTLIDSVDDLVIAINQTLSEIGARPLSRNEVCSFIGKGARNMVQRSLTAVLGEKPDEHLVDKLYLSYVHNMQSLDGKYSKLLPHVTSSLMALKQAGFKLAVVTNKPSIVVEPILKRFELTEYFSIALGADSVEHPKPAPDMLEAAAKALGLSINETVMIGDSMNDALAAKNARIMALLLKTGYNEGINIEDWVQINTPNFPVFDSMQELSQYLLPFQRS